MSGHRHGRGVGGRRSFAKRLAVGGAGLVVACDPPDVAPTPIIPPPNARVQTTACAYCSVGCGYKVYSWPVGECGGPQADRNALGTDLPAAILSGMWISPQMCNVVTVDGAPHNIVIMPDADATVVNPGGDHSLGGSLARKLYSEETETNDRFLQPRIRVGETLRAISWEDALELVARVSTQVLDEHGPLAWGMKTYSYQFYENTYAITKLALGAVGTPCWAPHDKPAEASDTPGLSDAGIDPFSAAYVDWRDAEVIFVSGVSLYDAHGVLYSQWVRGGGAQLIVVNPRRDVTAEYAEASGGLFLQIRPGTDTLLHNAIARVMLDEGWHDEDFIAQYVADEDEVDQNAADSWRRRRYAMDFDRYAEFILSDDLYDADNAAPLIGIEPAQIREAAAMLAQPDADGARPRTSFMLEKGNYWGHNYENTASLASLGLLCGAGNRPGKMISRAGGHQRGMIKAAPYPLALSPDTVDGHPVGCNLDRWALAGNLRLAWVIGCTWAGGGTAAASQLFETLATQTTGAQTQLDPQRTFTAAGTLDLEYVVQRLLERTRSGGMVLVQQDLYPQAMTELADLVLPAATWGEAPFSRMQAERRLRHYPQLMDAPGETRPDWWIIAQVAQRMGLDGFDWADGNAVFEEAAEHTAGGANDYRALVQLAQERGEPASAMLAGLGTTGVQCPITRDNDALVGTVRLHSEGFSTPNGKAMFVRGDWRSVELQQQRRAPRASEMWVTNRRTSANWSAMIEDIRNPFRMQQMPENPLELHPDDASELGLRTGDRVVVRTAADDELDAQPAQFEAVVKVTDTLRRGVACTYFNHLGRPSHAANNAVAPMPDPINNIFAFKLGRGRVERLT